MKAKYIDSQAVEHIAIGASLLGTGGGGDPTIGKLLAQRAIAENGPVRLLDVTEVPDKEWIIPTAMMGAPLVMLEKIPSGEEPLRAFRDLEAILGRKAFATMSLEAGGLNSTIPIFVAANMRIPLVDADGMGRAFPDIPMVTMTLHGISATPMTMADEKGNTAVLHTIDNEWTEKLSRALTVQMGGSSLIALYAMRGKEAKAAVIRHSISFEENLGRKLLETRRSKTDPIEPILRATGGCLLFEGRIDDIQRSVHRGFLFGEVTIAGLGNYRGETLKVEFQNEHLVARQGARVLASVPDLICIVEKESAQPITCESLKFGVHVMVIGMPCHRTWRSRAGVALVGPRRFGYKFDYVPLERRAPSPHVAKRRNRRGRD